MYKTYFNAFALDTQTYKNFSSVAAVTEPEKNVRAQSSKHLRQLLQEDHRYVFTLIQKFGTKEGEKFPILTDRSDIIVITDEAHRSQYDTLALNMRNALPHANFIAFTGTPLLAGEEKTKEVFGDYISVYNFKQSIEDGATVPLYYENRIPELQLINENFNEEISSILDNANLDEAETKALEREFKREYHLITREDRLEKIAEDIVNHFIGRGFKGKAMVVAVDKATAVKMYTKVQNFWKKKIKVEKDKKRLNYLESTDMAVIISQSQNEIEDFKKIGLDIETHRKRLVKEDLETRFKDSEDPLRIVFVCAMWMTGFDVPSCSTIYLDKPMKNHTLMQAIARANRVYRDKVNGLIVDYIGVFRNLQKALALYAATDEGADSPIRDKSALVEDLKIAIEKINQFCIEREVDLDAILIATGFYRHKLKEDAVNQIIDLRLTNNPSLLKAASPKKQTDADESVDKLLLNDELKKKYLSLYNQMIQNYKGILPDTRATEFSEIISLLTVFAKKIYSLSPKPDIEQIITSIDELLDESVATESYVIKEESKLLDLSKIDFDALRLQFEKGKKRIEAEKLKNKLEQKINHMIGLNSSRMNFKEEFERMIEEYNSGSSNIEELYEQLLNFTKNLNEEDKRAAREKLSEEELALLDKILIPEIEISTKDKNEIKKIVKQLLLKLQPEKLVLDWKKKQQTRSSVKLCIDETLDELPRIYSPDLYQKVCDEVYRYFYEAYPGDGMSKFTFA